MLYVQYMKFNTSKYIKYNTLKLARKYRYEITCWHICKICAHKVWYLNVIK